MIEKNVRYLEDQMFYTGFSEIPKDKLHEKIKEGKDEFQLVHDVKYGQDNVRAMLNFKMSEENPGMYFYNSFDLLLKKPDKEETIQQNFRVAYGNSYSLKEAYNMLEGRSVFKNFIKVDREDKSNQEKYTAWAYLDLNDKDQYGNYPINKVFKYDVEKIVEQYPIKALEYQQNKKQMLESLKKGNLYYTKMETSRGEEVVYIEAAPRFNGLKLYDKDMEPIRLSMKKEPEAQAVNQEQGQNAEHSVNNNEASQANNNAQSPTAENGGESGKAGQDSGQQDAPKAEEAQQDVTAGQSQDNNAVGKDKNAVAPEQGNGKKESQENKKSAGKKTSAGQSKKNNARVSSRRGARVG